MFAHEAPFLQGLHGGAQLRTEMTKIQNYAELNAEHGGTYGEDTFKPFLADMRNILKNESGTAADGLYLGVGVKDLRPLCFKVIAAGRMAAANKDGTNYSGVIDAFFKTFEDKWVTVEPLKFTKDLPATISIVDGTATLSVTVTGGTAPLKYTWARNGQVVQGQTTATCPITTAGEYQVVVVDNVGESISSAKCTATVAAGKNGV